MSNFDQCPTCHEWGFISSHKCDPAWDAVLFEYNDETDPNDWYVSRGHDAEEAALWLADKYFSTWDFPTEMEIWVKKPTHSQSKWEKFIVEVEPIPRFTAQKKKVEDAQ